MFQTTTVLTTSALLRSRVSHMKPWGKEYGSCRIFSLSASIGPWLVTTSSAQTAQLVSNYLKLFSNHLVLLRLHFSWVDTKITFFKLIKPKTADSITQTLIKICFCRSGVDQASQWHLPLVHRPDTSANSCHGNQLNLMPQSMPIEYGRTPTVLHSWHVFGMLASSCTYCVRIIPVDGTGAQKQCHSKIINNLLLRLIVWIKEANNK